MNCHIIFYMAKKTSLCEKALKKSIDTFSIHSEKTIFATSPKQLGSSLINALSVSNIVFTVGGLSDFDEASIENVFSNALSKHPEAEVKKLRNTISDNHGYLITQGCQAIIALPDEPDEISNILNKSVQEYLQKHINLN